MTDKEIIKVLKKYIECAEGTQIARDVGGTLVISLLQNALDLINRQQAEIERLNALIAETNEYRGEVIHAITHIDEVKAEAIKEFAERLKSEMIGKFCSHFDGELTNAIIDKVLKEMVGDDK